MQKVTPKGDVGVIVGRFQIHMLHDAHRELIQTVLDKHDRVIIFLGLANTRNTRNNPLDFESRKLMIQEQFKDVEIHYINDVQTDELWSKKLDEQLDRLLNPGQTVLLYGSRDSFISHYKGRHTTVELESKSFVSGTDVRKKITNKVKASEDFRAGVIYATGTRYPAAMPTVDIAVFNRGMSELLLARKPNETLLRFIGGFVSPTDKCLEDAAARELKEETGGNLEVDKMHYVCSSLIADWRWVSEQDKIMTSLFMTYKLFGSVTPTDDIEELRWVNPEKLTANDVVPEHRELLEKLKAFIETI